MPPPPPGCGRRPARARRAGRNESQFQRQQEGPANEESGGRSFLRRRLGRSAGAGPCEPREAAPSATRRRHALRAVTRTRGIERGCASCMGHLNTQQYIEGSIKGQRHRSDVSTNIFVKKGAALKSRAGIVQHHLPAPFDLTSMTPRSSNTRSPYAFCAGSGVDLGDAASPPGSAARRPSIAART